MTGLRKKWLGKFLVDFLIVAFIVLAAISSMIVYFVKDINPVVLELDRADLSNLRDVVT